MTWENPQHFIGDQQPKGLGRRQQPDDGAFAFTVLKSEFRAPRNKPNAPARYYLTEIRVDSGEQKGMVFGGVNLAPPMPSDPEGMRNARDAECKKALAVLNPEIAGELAQIQNQNVKITNAHFDGKSGHMWWESAKVDGQYPNYLFLTEAEYNDIMSGKFRPAKKNDTVASAPAASLGGATLGTQPATLSSGPTLIATPPVNGAGGALTPVAPVAGAGAPTSLLGSQ